MRVWGALNFHLLLKNPSLRERGIILLGRLSHLPPSIHFLATSSWDFYHVGEEEFHHPPRKNNGAQTESPHKCMHLGTHTALYKCPLPFTHILAPATHLLHTPSPRPQVLSPLDPYIHLLKAEAFTRSHLQACHKTANTSP